MTDSINLETPEFMITVHRSGQVRALLDFRFAPAVHDLTGCLREYFTKPARKSLLFKRVRMAILRSCSVYCCWR